MSNKWIHGTEVYFSKWMLPLGKQPHKGGMESHSAIFLTTSKEYALGAANGLGGLCTASLIKDSNILNMNNCSSSQSEEYRIEPPTPTMSRRIRYYLQTSPI
jgi:hypothetical protein